MNNSNVRLFYLAAVSTFLKYYWDYAMVAIMGPISAEKNSEIATQSISIILTGNH
jgi:hypothetical protein